jgi:hypothetical protein
VIWDEEAELTREAPEWSLTGQMLLWADGSPAHVQQDPFQLIGKGWEAATRVSRSTRDGSKWLALTIRLDTEVRAQWEQAGVDARDRAFQALSGYLQLREWYGDDLGVLYLK